MENSTTIYQINKRRNFIKFNIWYACTYFIVYSFCGFLLETVFGIYSKGVLESRQSFLFGPFCIIYGIGALLMITFLSGLKNRPIVLFLLSAVIGTITEYLMSYFCELIFHFKWWDYSTMDLNINGRICLYFFIMWGFLGIILIKYINPALDKFINFLKSKINIKILKTALLLTIAFLIFDASITAIALKSFYLKIVNDFELDVAKEEYVTVQNKLFDEENMVLTYPNMQIAGTKYNNIYITNLYDSEKSYYFQIFNK